MPRVLADLGVFVNDPGDEDPADGTPHAIVPPSEMLERMVAEIAQPTKAASR